ncbi:MAG TPA: response regulator [Ktedonobacterales bacterium]
MANNFDKFAILDSFLDEVQSYLPEIQAHLDRLQQQPGDMDTIEETYRRTHTIAGSAAMMEFSGLAHVAQGMEDTLGEALDNQAALDPPTIGLMRRSCGRMSRLMEQIKAGGEDGSIVSEDDADRAAWRGGAAGAQAAGKGSYSGAGAFADFAASQTGTSVPSSPAMQIPDWLAAFAASESDSIGSASASGFNPAASGLHAPSTPPFGAPPAPGASNSTSPQTGPRDPFSASLSHLPSGGYPAHPLPSTDATGPQPSLDDILQSFKIPSDGLNGAPVQPAANPAPGNWAVSSTQQGAPSWAQPPALDPGNGWQQNGQEAGQAQHNWQTPSVSPASSQSSWQMPQSPETQAPWQQATSGGLGQQPSWAASSADPFARSDFAAQGTAAMPVPPVAGQSPGGSYAPAPMGQEPADLDELRQDEEAVRRQVASLRDVSAAIHEAADAMEDERSELRSFLDGSRDALERLEEWAGQQMGLDLRQSPDAVRKYLPLSVIWVTTTRLKKLATLLTNSGRSVTATQEQIEETLNDLRAALANVGQVYNTIQSFGGTPERGFSATVAQVNWNPPAPPAAPVVDSAASSASLAPGARAEIERSVREQLRRELEDDVRAEVAAEVRRDEEERIRQEIQIQVRRQLLSELTPGFGASNVLSMGGVAHALPQMANVSERAPKPVRVTSEQSPEALEVFRDEAQEHLQSITTGLAQLERNPGDVPVLQSVRRAMHTLKGAAGMMGFTAIQQTAHASEDLLDKMVEDEAALTQDVLSLLLDTSEALDQLVSGAADGSEEQDLLVRSLMARYARLAGSEPAPVPVGQPSGQHDATQIALADEGEDALEQRSGATNNDLSVRLQLSKLDDLVNLFGELLINRSVLEERVDRLNRLVSDSVVVSERLRDVGSQLDTRFEAATLPSGRQNTGGLPPNPMREPAAGWAAGRNGGGSGGLRADANSFANEFDELELDRYTEFHRLSRGLSEGVADMVTLGHEMEAIIRDTQASFARENRLSSDFQDRLLKARLVPLESLIPRLYRAARASALRENKDVEFFAEGAGTEVDRKVFEEVAGPLLHLVRNSVNHGIERPNVRELAGKPRAGKITVSAAYEGNQVVISVADDGAGIDPEKIRATAIAKGWIDPYAHLTEKEAINLIFRSGVSTAEALTEEAGRGVGLDVVRDSVTRLRGTIEVDSTVGQGTQFTMKFPISLQIARAVLVKVGQQTLAIPMAVVDQIGRLDYYQRTSGPAPAIEMRGEQYPLAHLANYLKLTPGQIDDRSSVLLVNAGKRRVALLVDSIAAQQEVVSKPLGPHLRDVPGVAGAAVLGNGQVVLILELLELLAQQPRGEIILPEPGAKPTITMAPTSPMTAVRSPSQPRMPSTAVAPAPTMPAPRPPQPPAATISQREFVVAPRPTGGPGLPNTAPPPGQKSFVLVVDDSPSVRRVVSNMLKAHGWEVQTARDGVEALEVIAREVPAAVLLDIEMPRMDGYELMATVRSQDQYRRLPLIVLTSRAATKHQQRAMQLGADAYVVKPYQDEELLTTIANLVQAR